MSESSDAPSGRLACIGCSCRSMRIVSVIAICGLRRAETPCISNVGRVTSRFAAAKERSSAERKTTLMPSAERKTTLMRLSVKASAQFGRG